MDRLKTTLLSMVLLSSAILTMPQHLRAAGASVTVAPPAGMIRAGDTIAVPVLIDSAGENINAVMVTLRYSTALLRAERVAREQSFLQLWPEEPRVDAAQGIVTFTGGRPGGIIASRATAVTIYFTVLAGGTATIMFDTASTALYLHDGEGTKVASTALPTDILLADALVEAVALSSTTHPTSDTWSRERSADVAWTTRPGALYSFVFSTNAAEQPDDVPETTSGSVLYEALDDGIYHFTLKEQPAGQNWSQPVQRRFLIDATAPLPFAIATPDPASTGGTRILAWVATDQTSGVARYAVSVGGTQLGDVTSPLTVDPAWEGKDFVLTAFDAAGNSTVATLRLPANTSPLNWFRLLGAAMLLVLAALGSLLAYHRLRR